MLISKNERKKEGVCVWVSVGVFGCVHVERERERWQLIIRLNNRQPYCVWLKKKILSKNFDLPRTIVGMGRYVAIAVAVAVVVVVVIPTGQTHHTVRPHLCLSDTL